MAIDHDIDLHRQNGSHRVNGQEESCPNFVRRRRRRSSSRRWSELSVSLLFRLSFWVKSESLLLAENWGKLHSHLKVTGKLTWAWTCGGGGRGEWAVSGEPGTCHLGYRRKKTLLDSLSLTFVHFDSGWMTPSPGIYLRANEAYGADGEAEWMESCSQP